MYMYACRRIENWFKKIRKYKKNHGEINHNFFCHGRKIPLNNQGVKKYGVPKNSFGFYCVTVCECVNYMYMYLKAKRRIRSIFRPMEKKHQKKANKQITIVEIMCGPRKDILYPPKRTLDNQGGRLKGKVYIGKNSEANPKFSA